MSLHGIDAPESAQTCKGEAGKDYRCGQTAALADHIGKRVVAACRANAEDLNAWLVRQGDAIAYRRYT